MDEHDTTNGPRAWVDYQSAVALTGISRTRLAWALADGLVAYDSDRPGHPGVLLLRLDHVQAVSEEPAGNGHPRLLEQGTGVNHPLLTGGVGDRA